MNGAALRIAGVCLACFLSAGCAAGVVIDTTATVVGGVVDGVASAGGAVVDLVIDDGEDDDAE